MNAVQCIRCQEEHPAVTAEPVPGPTGREILEKICSNCWAEWQHAEVMVINELRLNFMDPRSQEILTRHMRDFLHLDGPPSGPPPGPPEEQP